MPDCSAVWMKIGGPLPADRIVDLVVAIDADGAGFEWSGPTDEGDIWTYIKEAIDQKKPLNISSNEQAWGRFREVEALCQEIGLTYAQHDAGNYSWDSSMELFEPGMVGPRNVTASMDEGNVCLTIAEIDQLLVNGTIEAELAFLRRFQVFAVPMTLVGEWPEDDDEDETATGKESAEPAPEAADQVRSALLAAWHFIENVPDEDPERQDKFFTLREQVRSALAESRGGPSDA